MSGGGGIGLVWLALLATRIMGQPEFLLSRRDIVDKSVDSVETFLQPRDFENIPEREVDLRKLGIHVDPDPTLGSRNQGDIAEPSPAKRPQFDSNGIARNSIRQPYRRWPRNEIPYALSSQYGQYSRSVIAKAMDEYHTKTCIRFVPRDARRHRDYVYIHPDDGCYSLVGRTGGRQPLSLCQGKGVNGQCENAGLDSGCIQVGTIVHELMHAVGFFHEQSRYDRDQFIQVFWPTLWWSDTVFQILWPNVLRGADDQFEKYSFNTIDQLGEPYDFGSIMHYGPYAFSSNGKRTIVPRRTGSHKMGQRLAFSEVDLRKINKLYQCEPTSTRSGASVNSRGTRPVQQEVTAINGSEECEDRNWRCIFWSLPVFQYCDSSEAIRKEICALSCGTCNRPKGVDEEVKGECVDKSALCSKLGRSHCEGIMGKLFCMRTCGVCT